MKIEAAKADAGAVECWKQAYDRASRTGEGYYARNLYGSRQEAQSQRRLVLQWIGGMFKRRKGLAIDIGCGTGEYGGLLKSQGWEYLGIDMSRQMLHRRPMDNGGLWVLQSLAEELPVKDERADLVLCLGVLQTSLRPGILLSEIARVLRRGGVVILSTLRKIGLFELAFFPLAFLAETDKSPARGEWYSRLVASRDFLVWRDRPVSHPFRRYRERALLELMGKSGFHIIRRRYPGRVGLLPVLLNSQTVTVVAIKR
jgi:SAM-dependent methyltransferase